MANRQGTLIWQKAKIDWKYETFQDEKTFKIEPHFKIKATDESGNSVEWPNVQIDTDSVDDLKGITDFTKLPRELRDKVLDNCVLKLREEEPEVTRLNPYVE